MVDNFKETKVLSTKEDGFNYDVHEVALVLGKFVLDDPLLKNDIGLPLKPVPEQSCKLSRTHGVKSNNTVFPLRNRMFKLSRVPFVEEVHDRLIK